MLRLTLLALAVLGAAVPKAGAHEPPARVRSIEGVTEYRLPNGLKVLLMPDASRPLVHVHLTVLVGSRHEGYGETGMAHLLEHMLCKGTVAHPNIMKALRERGASNANAYTSKDMTRFIETLPASDDNLEFAIRLEADRLANSVVKRDELLTEMTVVRNEFERQENEPELLLLERMGHAAFRWHNYGNAILGSRSDIERVPVDNLQAFYKKHYRPDNAVLVVTGRFDEAKTLALAARYFGAIAKPAEALAPVYTREPAQDGERNVTLRRTGTVGAVGAVYHIPAGSHPDYPAVMMLADCLSSTPGGRLYQALVETKLAANVNGTASGFHDPWLMQFSARVEKAAGVDAARDALVKTVESLAERPVTETEVERVRKKFAVVYEQAQADAEAMAGQLDFYSGVGDWRLFFWERDAVEKVTAAEVNRVARIYLTRNNRTIGVYAPSEQAERVDVPESPALAPMLEGLVGRKKVTVTEAFDPTPENIEKRVVRGTLGAIKTAFLPKPTAGEQVNLNLTLRYGNEQALAGKTMPARLLPYMLLYGTKTRSRQQIVDELDRLRGGVIFNGSAGLLHVRMIAKKEHLAKTLALVGELLREPAFPPAEFATLKAAMIANIAANQTDPGARASLAVQRKLKPYPKSDIRYQPTFDEQIEQVKATTVQDVKDLYAHVLGANVGELAVVGDFDPAVVVAGLEPALTGWTSKVKYQRMAQPLQSIERGETIRIETPDKANAVYFAALSYPLTDRDPDYPALAVGTDLLGGHSIVSRLGAKIRKEQGLSYGVEADFVADPLDEAAVFALVGTTNPANMAKVRDMIGNELKAFLTEGVTVAELEAAKKAYLQEMAVNLTSDAGVAARLGEGLHLGRTFEHRARLMKRIEALTPGDLQRAFRRVVDPAKLVIAEAGDFATAEAKKSTKP